MDVRVFLLAAVAILNLVLSFLIIFHGQRERHEWLFGLPPFAAALWGIGVALVYVLGSRWQGAAYVPYVASSFIFPVLSIFLIFFTDFPQSKKIRALYIGSTIFLESIILGIVLFPGIIIRGIILTADGSFHGIQFGSYYSIFLFYILLYAAICFILMWRAYQMDRGIERVQIAYIFVGVIVSSVAGIVANAILPATGNFQIFWLGPAAVIFFSVLMYYAVAKHHLLNVRVIATEWFAFAIILIFFSNILFATTRQAFIVDGILWLLIVIFSIFLVRGTLREVRELERISNAKTEFISIASHQLRTPLTAVKGYLSLLLEGTYGTLNVKPQEVLKKVYASNERLSSIVEDLLNVSRMDQGRLMYNFVRTDLVHVVSEIIDELKITAEIKHIDLIFEKPQDANSFVMQADTEKLHQAIGNLVDNAIKYTPQGSVRVKMEKISGDGSSGSIVIAVQDSGIGLSPLDKKKIFERFSRGREGMRVNTKGSGLGLFIAKTIVEAHGGALRAESAGRNKGSSFIVELPLDFQQPVTKN